MENVLSDFKRKKLYQTNHTILYIILYMLYLAIEFRAYIVDATGTSRLKIIPKTEKKRTYIKITLITSRSVGCLDKAFNEMK